MRCDIRKGNKLKTNTKAEVRRLIVTDNVINLKGKRNRERRRDRPLFHFLLFEV